jgi:uncharacterized membrane protein
LLSPASAAWAALAVALIAPLAFGIALVQRYRGWLELAAGACAVYLLSVATIDLFQGRVGGDVPLEELQKQAQVALSVLWALLGAGAFVVGLSRRRILVRQAGLGLLALATAKVFVFDLSALDVAYRVLSLIALGVLLLGSAYLYQRLRVRDVAS